MIISAVLILTIFKDNSNKIEDIVDDIDTNEFE